MERESRLNDALNFEHRLRHGGVEGRKAILRDLLLSKELNIKDKRTREVLRELLLLPKETTSPRINASRDNKDTYGSSKVSATYAGGSPKVYTGGGLANDSPKATGGLYGLGKGVYNKTKLASGASSSVTAAAAEDLVTAAKLAARKDLEAEVELIKKGLKTTGKHMDQTKTFYSIR